MAKSISVAAAGAKTYSIELTHGFAELCTHLHALDDQPDRKVCIVTDSNVGPLYADALCTTLKSMYDTVLVHTLKAGEENKNLENVSELYEALILAHFDRRDLLVALGGGVVGDLTGFAAATYLRGIDFIQVPTTLLSQVDSSIGGKTGVDFLQYKNMVGAFYQPRLVYMNLDVLKTLPEKQIVSGLGEIIKHGLIKDAGYYRWLVEHRDGIFALEPDILEEMIARSCDIKREVVERDPKEQGERALLNFGHTIGHAVEKLSDFSLCHGECVGIGMIAAAYLSSRYGILSGEAFEDICSCLAAFGFRTAIEGIPPEEILRATKSDKKMAGSQVKFVLLSEVGNAYIFRELSDAQILEGIRYVCVQSKLS